MASGRLILRDLTRMICVDMTQATKTANLSNKPGATLKLQSAP
jgi:hypothetical protein